jgi:S-(hydroxymethyl)mycothiol dehydrogenase
MPPSPVPRWSARAASSPSTWTTESCTPHGNFGATHTVNAKVLDAVETIQDLTDGFGADVVIDAVGRPETWKQAFYARDLAGTVVLVGVPTPDMKLEMPLVDFFSRGGALKSSWYGDCLPERDFPTLISLYLQGRLPLDKFVSERIGIEGVEEAFHKMHAGEVLRSVVVFLDEHPAGGHQRQVRTRRRLLGCRQQHLAGR